MEPATNSTDSTFFSRPEVISDDKTSPSHMLDVEKLASYVDRHTLILETDTSINKSCGYDISHVNPEVKTYLDNIIQKNI